MPDPSRTRDRQAPDRQAPGSVDKVRLQRVVDVMRHYLGFPPFDIGSMLMGRG